jgi:Coenzyme PQQ synthesis protein D (PqqD)
MRKIEPHQPQARKDGIVVEELADEVLIYDLERHKAHCLNRTAALIWKKCDGHTTVAEIAWLLQNELKAPVDEEVVWFALSQLEKDHLLQEKIARSVQMAGISRREVVRRLGLAAAIAIPVVTSIVAPTPAQAGTCSHTGGACATSADCCAGCFCAGNTCNGMC